MLRRSPPGLTQGVTPPDAALGNDQNIQMVAAICIQLNEHYIALNWDTYRFHGVMLWLCEELL